MSARSNAGRAFPSRLPWCGRSEPRHGIRARGSIRRTYHSPSYPIRSMCSVLNVSSTKRTSLWFRTGPRSRRLEVDLHLLFVFVVARLDRRGPSDGTNCART